MIRPRAVLAALLPAALLASAAPAPASASATDEAPPDAPRTAQAGSVRIAFDGRTATLRAPERVGERARIRVRCGSQTLARKAIGTATARVRPRQRLALRLSRAVPDAEWCAYEILAGATDDAYLRPSGAGALRPASPAPPAALTPQTPGVRAATTTDVAPSDVVPSGGKADFLVAGSILTVRFAGPTTGSRLLTLVCGTADKAIGVRTIAVQGGRRVLTADLAADLAAARWCLVEQDDGGRDVLGADLQPSGATPPQVPSAP